MTGAMSWSVMVASLGGDGRASRRAAGAHDGQPVRSGCSSGACFGEKSPVLVSEGGLEPPCPFGALAPQASASAYSATRTYAGARRCRAGRLTIANPGRSRRSELICPAKPAPYTTGQRHAARVGAGVPAEAPVAQRECDHGQVTQNPATAAPTAQDEVAGLCRSEE